MEVNGVYLDGQSPKRYPARLEGSTNLLNSISLRIEKDNDQFEQRTLSYSELKFESRLGNSPREISFGEDELFISDNHEEVDQFLRAFNDKREHSLIHRLESSITMVIGGTVAAALVMWVTVVYGFPAAANYIAHSMPQFVTEQFGSSLTILDKTLFDESELSEERQIAVRTLLTPYLEDYAALNPKLNFRHGAGANAFALPSGDIVLTDDFVALVETDEELIAVFLHEVGHLKHKHILRRALQDIMVTLIIVFIIGDIDTVDLVTGLPTLLADLSYSRKFEREADTFALAAMQDYGISTEHFANVMQRLSDFYKEPAENQSEDGFKLPDFLSTHPGTEERVERARNFVY